MHPGLPLSFLPPLSFPGTLSSADGEQSRERGRFFCLPRPARKFPFRLPPYASFLLPFLVPPSDLLTAALGGNGGGGRRKGKRGGGRRVFSPILPPPFGRMLWEEEEEKRQRRRKAKPRRESKRRKGKGEVVHDFVSGETKRRRRRAHSLSFYPPTFSLFPFLRSRAEGGRGKIPATMGRLLPPPLFLLPSRRQSVSLTWVFYQAGMAENIFFSLFRSDRCYHPLSCQHAFE